MKNRIRIALLVFSCLVLQQVQAQNVTLSGHIRDAKNGEELIGANIFVQELKSGTVTNVYGFYSLSLPKGKYKVEYSYLGYNSIDTTLDIQSNRTFDIELSEAQRVLEETVITGERQDKNVSENRMSVVSIDVKTVRKIPILLGEVDVIKALQLLPGVQSAGDGNTLTIVRGGNVDHNLVLLDEAVVYNPSHVVGFFSVFNGDAIKDFDLYKGGIPSIYGGRLASVLDIRMKDGNSKNFSASGGIGILSSRLTLEGPLSKKKDLGSFMISGRRSYFDLFFPLSEQTKDAIANFGDLNAKINFKLSDKDRIYISAYSGRDRLGFAGLAGFGWGNTTTTVRWNHIFNTKWFSNTSLIYSRYNYNIDFNISKNLNFSRINYIDDLSLKQDYTYYHSPKSTVKFGFWSTFHTFLPGKIEPITTESLIQGGELPKKRALSQAYYGSHEYKFSSRFQVEYGVRLSVFSNIGGREFVYANGQKNYFQDGSIRPSDIIDTNFYQNGEFYNTTMGVEPRLNLTYQLNSESSIKGSYNRMYQYLHLIQNIAASTGQEFWTPSTPYIKPQLADQVAVGYFRNFMKNTLEFSAEVYYKYMQNTVELIDNADINFNEAVESQLVAGQGRAYGLELFLRKSKGRTTGWIAYTIAKSDRKADNINRNEWYPFRFDRRHYATVVLSHDLNKRVNFSGSFIFATGDAYTAPVGQYQLNGVTVPLYSDRNALRIPAYHRMDVSMTLYGKKKEGKRWLKESSWVFSIYNVYGRKNYYTLNFRTDENTGENAAYKTYLFRMVPSVTYNFKF
ncbi:MAG: TonB-dependent receptor [Bacteroidetes bacterium]|nr:MAG: TonB-dependent receptor [Bacteroidota bacterium]